MWIIYILEGIRYTAQLTKDKILKIHQLMKESMDLVKEKLPNIYSKDLLLTIYQQPYCKISFLEEAKLAKRQTASKYLQELEKIGLFRSVKVGREIYYVNDAFLKILTT
jgi:Fic family protein